MTKGLLIELGLSLVGVAVLVGVSYLAGAWRDAALTIEAAAERLRFDEPDFRPGAWLLGADAKSAAALSADENEVAVVFVLGDGLATRRLKRARVVQDGKSIIFVLNEPSRKAVPVAAKDEAEARRWLSSLAAVAV